MKILLIHPQNYLHSYQTGIYQKVGGYSPLTMPTLASLVSKDLGAQVRIVNEMTENIDEKNEAADLVGITAIAPTAYRAYQIADEFRKRRILVVLGGMHPTLMPKEALQHADCIVTGYAEHTWPQLLKDFQSRKMRKVYEQTEDYSFCSNSVPKRQLAKTTPYMVSDTIELTRGCPHSCEFCILAGFGRGRYYKKPIKEAVGELQSLKSKYILFLDANLIGDKNYIKEFLLKMIPFKKWWAGCVTQDVADDDELLKIMANSGCKGVLIGFETLCQTALDEANKPFNRVKRYKSIIRKLHKWGLAVHGCFVFGFDHDTPKIFGDTFNFVEEAKVDFPQYTIYTPFPGTPVYKRLLGEGRILTQNWSLYNGQNCVFEPSKMSAGELKKGLQDVQSKTYRLPSALKRIRQSRFWLWPILLITNINYRRYTSRIPSADNQFKDRP